MAGLSVVFVLCWSSGFIGAKLGSADASVLTILMWRFLPLALVLSPLLLRVPAGPGSSRTAGVLRQVAVGALSQTGYVLTVYWAIGLGVSTGTTALVDGIQPLVVAALAGPLLGAVVTGRQWLGLGLGLVGVLVVTLADAFAPGSRAPGWSYLLPFVGMLCLVAATFLERRARVVMPPLRVLAIHCLTSGVIFTGLAVAAGQVVPPLTPGFWIALAWLIVLPTFGGYGLYWLLLRRLGVTAVNTLMFLVPPVTALWGAALFAEPLTPLTISGFVVALAATALVTVPSSDRRRAPATCSGVTGSTVACHRS
ncbi:DMT family transporter [Microlunatus speluncae]|uniref:DMT family transporter n=1 Tax=Microlunatus speluncae TaxID=2594267 RepID=UPI001C2DB0EA|nr:DMT family transporter [Microlunatus speluncae]